MKIQKNIPLKNYTTFKIGGEAKFFCVVTNFEELEKAYLWANSKSLKTFILGGGSNVLFSDQGFDGLVIKLENKKLDKIKENKDSVLIKCEAGVALSDLMKFSVEEGLTGLEWAAGIPGTFGGAVRGNAGAFGPSMSDSILKIEVLKKEKGRIEKELIEKEECEFDYRNSVLKKNRDLTLWSATINLQRGDKKEIDKKFQEYIQKRQIKQPPLGKFPSAGSFFKNPKVPEDVIKKFEEDKDIKAKDGKVPSGWLIEGCGLKGHKIGGAMVSDIQANFIVNTGDATFDDMMVLLSVVKQKVRNNFGVQLEEEVEIVI